MSSMHCPVDKTKLRFVSVSDQGDYSYQCPSCEGTLTTPKQPGFQGLHNLEKTDLVCPRDGDVLYQTETGSLCGECGSSWKTNTSVSSSLPKTARVVTAEITALFVLSIVLSAWQLGQLNSSADAVASAATAPIRGLAIVAWFVIFSLLFLVPATVYHQLVLSHRPHIHKVLYHPLVRWLPAIIIVLIAANIYFLTP